MYIVLQKKSHFFTLPLISQILTTYRSRPLLIPFWYISSCSDAICCNMQKLREEEERSFIVDEKFPLENLHVSLHRILQRTCQGAKFCCLKVSLSQLGKQGRSSMPSKLHPVPQVPVFVCRILLKIQNNCFFKK